MAKINSREQPFRTNSEAFQRTRSYGLQFKR